MIESTAAVSGDLFREHGRFLWGLCYRMTGSAADADDVVQETFVRALEHPPPSLERPWRPWLVRVAMNLARDHLRRRRRHYPGPWLPSPIETGEDAALPAVEAELGDGRTTEGRYELLETVSFAFLLALEALTPLQRAVLLLRDVFDYDVRDTAAALDLSESNVKTTHHRARRAMAAYDRRSALPPTECSARTQETLARFLAGLASQDVGAIESMLAEGVRSISDSGGEFSAAHKVVVGRNRVMRLLLGLVGKGGAALTAAPVVANGLPALLVTVAGATGRTAPRILFRIELDGEGRITEVHSVLATRKLTAIASSRGAA